MNKVILMGRLTRNPELKYTPNNVAVARFNIAVDRDFKNAQGEREADIPTIVAWRQTAEFICRHFNKGKPIIIEGKLQTRNYDDRDGKKRFVTEVVADAAKFVLTDNTRSPLNQGYGEGRTNTDIFSGGMNPVNEIESFSDEADDLPF